MFTIGFCKHSQHEGLNENEIWRYSHWIQLFPWCAFSESLVRAMDDCPKLIRIVLCCQHTIWAQNSNQSTLIHLNFKRNIHWSVFCCEEWIECKKTNVPWLSDIIVFGHQLTGQRCPVLPHWSSWDSCERSYQISGAAFLCELWPSVIFGPPSLIVVRGSGNYGDWSYNYWW